ncbi:ATP-dependent endonuclease [Lentibacillus sp. CBA3610]|uniref:ATP-dependent nuclease n=1 Tax=Lentibacillus sp. CBA3610 TaxID=2518176 RepID=UPI001595E53F|nr:AAA family ATPase [Lentibacillus sp. CBA3610]QKY70292.1 ATP-dependent endonuclease [Lentibacillus sp. CBA3610]
MKLVKFLISNFRGISGDVDFPGVEIDFDDINLIFLIGQNNTGKSSVLSAYEYFVKSNTPAEEGDFHNQNDKPISIEAWIEAENDSDFEHQAMKTSMNPETGIARFRKVWNNKNEKGIKYTYNFKEEKWAEGGGGGFDSILQNACPEPIWLKGLDSVELVLEKVQKLVKEKVLDNASELERFKYIKTELEELRREVMATDFSQKVEGRLNDLMQETFPDLSVSLFGEEKDDLGKKLSNFINTDIRFSNQGFPVHMSNHGHGIRRQFLFNALRGLNHVFSELEKSKKQRDDEVIENIDQISAQHKKKMLLIEEPELFLHPQSIRMFTDVLYELSEGSEFQIMAATHSPIIVDLSRDHTTLLRTKMEKNGEIKLHQVRNNIFDENEKERLKMLNSFNPYVCEAFFNENVILVEGDTEAIIYRRLIDKFVEKEKIKLINAPLVVNCGSKMNIPSFQKVLRHFGIEYFVIHDLDHTFNKNGTQNAAWALNEKIYNEILEYDNSVKARRFIMERNFESAHQYEYKSSLGKPLSAYRLVDDWDIDDTSIPAIHALHACLNFTRDFADFDQEWVNARKSSATQEV